MSKLTVTHATRLDFRVGGREYNAGGPKGGPKHVFESRFMPMPHSLPVVGSQK